MFGTRRKSKLSLFDRLCWKFIDHLVKTNPEAAINLMGGGNATEQLAKLTGGNWDPRPRGVSSRTKR